jgi:hypothetical protein
MKDLEATLISEHPEDPNCTDYVLDPEASSVWITVGNISVYIMRTDEGVAVDLLPLHREGEAAIGSTWALDSEGESDEQAAGYLDALERGDCTFL